MEGSADTMTEAADKIKEAGEAEGLKEALANLVNDKEKTSSSSSNSSSESSGVTRGVNLPAVDSHFKNQANTTQR